MQEVVTLVKNRGDPQLSKTVPNWARAPWLEQHYSAKVLEATQGHRIITTHLPYNLLASALQGSKAKVGCGYVEETILKAVRHFLFCKATLMEIIY